MQPQERETYHFGFALLPHPSLIQVGGADFKVGHRSQTLSAVQQAGEMIPDWWPLGPRDLVLLITLFILLTAVFVFRFIVARLSPTTQTNATNFTERTVQLSVERTWGREEQDTMKDMFVHAHFRACTPSSVHKCIPNSHLPLICHGVLVEKLSVSHGCYCQTPVMRALIGGELGLTPNDGRDSSGNANGD